MKDYKINILSKIYIISLCVFISLMCILYLLYNTRASFFERILIFFGILFFNVGFPLLTQKASTDKEKLLFSNSVSISSLFTNRDNHSIIYWNEIGEVNASYFLFAETANVILKPKVGIKKKPIGFLVGFCGLPLDLLRDILAHLPPDAKVNLYPYLKRKLEGKQTWFYVK